MRDASSEQGFNLAGSKRCLVRPEQHEVGALTGVEHELGNSCVSLRTSFDVQRKGAHKAQRGTAAVCSAEHHAVTSLRHGPGFSAAIIEPRRAVQAEGYLASRDVHSPDQLGAAAVRLGEGHEVGNFAYAAKRREARDQHVGVGQVHLPAPGTVERRRQLPGAAALRVEKCHKHAWAVEVRPA